MLTAVQPVELVLPRGEVSVETRRVAAGLLLRPPRLNELPLGAEEGQVGWWAVLGGQALRECRRRRWARVGRVAGPSCSAAGVAQPSKPSGPPLPQFWDAHTVWTQLDAGGYFTCGAPVPAVLAAVREGGAGQAAAAHALGGCLSHLRDCLLDKQVGGDWGLGCVCGGGGGWGGGAGVKQAADMAAWRCLWRHHVQLEVQKRIRW